MKFRFAVCIPVYNNPATIVDVIDQTLAKTPYPLIVIDDGSDMAVERLYREKTGVASTRVSFIRHDVNGGKGRALQTAFKVAVARGFTHLITIDGDGQHDPADIPRLVEQAQDHPWDLIVGDRDMQTENVPGSSAFGKKFSNFWVQYQTDVGVADSQSGYRLYPLFHVQNMRFACSKYDFEIEVLIRLIWRGVKVRNIKVSVKYFPQSKRVSHFHKFKDNFRITLLNIALTTASLLKEQTSPFKSAAAMGLGVFVGCTPLFGLHTLLIALVAFVCRLNFVYLWVGSNISLPPFVPFLLIGAHYLGDSLLPLFPVWGTGTGASLVVGSLAVGLLLGSSTFFIVYSLKNKNADTPQKAWTGKNRNHVGTLFVKKVLESLGLRVTYFLLHFICFYYFLFAFRARRSFAEYWKITHPEMGWWERQLRMYRQIYIFAQTLVDRGAQRRLAESGVLGFQYVLDDSSEGFVERVETARQGVVIISSHMGGWDMALRFFAQTPSDKKIMAVMFGISGQFQHHATEGKNQRVEIIHYNENENTIIRMRNHLAQGHVVSVMGDRPVTQSYELMPFFGKLALFDTTPIRMAMACRSELYFVFSLKVGLTDYRLYTFPIENLDEVKKLPRDEMSFTLLRQYVSKLEEMVRLYPEQWFNFFPFWSEIFFEAHNIKM